MPETTEQDSCPLQLPGGILVLDYADAARAALAQVLGDATRVWSKREFARWLLESYTPATVRIDRAAALAPIASRELRQAPDDTRIRRVVEKAITALGEALRQCFESSREPFFVREMVDRQLVRLARDRFGLGYVAVDRESIALRDRLLALLAADYLARPRDYVDGTLEVLRAEYASAPLSGVRARPFDRRDTRRGGIGS